MVLLLALAAAACGSTPERRTEAGAERYELTGKVVSVDKPGKKLTVDHAAIPGFMDAMTMPYPVKDDPGLDAVAVGDEIAATVVSDHGLYWLENIRVTRKAPASEAAAVTPTPDR
jgi:protein SCO1/2